MFLCKIFALPGLCWMILLSLMHYLSFQFMIIMKYLIFFFFYIFILASPCLFPGCDSLLMKLAWGFWKKRVLIFAVCLPVFPIFSNLSLPPGDARGHHPGWGHHCFQPVVRLHRAPVCTVGSPLTTNLVLFSPLDTQYVVEEEDLPPLKPCLLLPYSVWVVKSQEAMAMVTAVRQEILVKC